MNIETHNEHKRTIEKYKWYDFLQYTVILLTTAAIPIWRRLGMYMVEMLVFVTIVKVIAQHKIGNPSLNRHLRIAFYGFIVYWMVLLFSLLWSCDYTTGWCYLQRKMIMLVFPLCFLLSDTSYLKRYHLRGIGYVFLISVCATFFHFLISAGVNMAHGSNFNLFYEDYYAHSRNGYRHHAYIAMYAITAMVFAFHELITYWKELKIWCRTLLIISIFILSAYIVLVNSRAGILVMIILSLVCIACMMITRRSLLLGLGLALVLCLSFGVFTRVFPSYTNRISKTIKNVEEVEGNGRLRLYHCNCQLICKGPIIGYGIGDYHKVQLDNYRYNGYYETADGDYNAHNQYMESLLQAGIFGLIALLLFLLTPLLVAFRHYKKCIFWICLLIGIVLFNLLFESMFERQMGLLFIGALYAVMVLMMSVENKKLEVRQL